ncbi:MAG: helix-turn-helix domain-containing protein [Firmicutes bacterium]|nr:helix-turn-helix domain-containing protein [Bacillota bacterium]
MRYYPIQIPFVLSKEFNEAVVYTEEVVEDLSDFVICVWQMKSRDTQPKTITNHVIVTDGCIDLVVDFSNSDIGFAGMSKTKFDDKIKTPAHWLGARMKPAAFQALTGLNASFAMDKFLPLTKVLKTFKKKDFFARAQTPLARQSMAQTSIARSPLAQTPLAQTSMAQTPAKQQFIELLREIVSGKSPNIYTSLFDRLIDNLPDTAEELYGIMGYSPKQTQRLFEKYFGFTPQKALNILRFQKVLGAMIVDKSNSSEAMQQTNYYDQAHFIKDFKKHLGITPSELVKLYARQT